MGTTVMPEASSKSYSFPEMAQIVGIDEKQLHFYAHKGLINPALSTDSTARFSQVDFARLKVIDRAHQLGYQPENIFNLIGSADDALKAEDPVSACLKFAMAKYKQVYDELGRCEPLEQLNKQCDLRLITTYIKHLKELQAGPAQQRHPAPKPQPQTKPRPVALNNGKSRAVPKQAPVAMPSPRIWSYSVAKLWDYMKKADRPQKTGSDGSQSPGAVPQGETHARASGDQDSSGLPKQTFPRSPGVRRPSMSGGRAPAARGMGKAADQTRAPWVIAGLVMTIAALGYFLFFRAIDETPPPHEATEQSNPQSETAAAVPDQAAAPEAAQPATLPDMGTQVPPEPAQVSEKQVSPGQPQEADMPAGSRGAQRELPDTTVSSNSQVQQKPPAEPATVKPPEQAIVAVEPVDTPTPLPPPETPTGVGRPALVRVEDLSLWHDSLNHIYRSDFTVLKNEAMDYQGTVSGYAFVYLDTSAVAADPNGLVLPTVELQAGRPAQAWRGVKFTINHFKQIRVTAVSTVPPDTISSGKVWIYSSEGELLLEKPFNVPIQPFFSTVADNPAAPEADKTELAATATPDRPAAPESSSPPVPEPRTPAPKTPEPVVPTPPAGAETVAVSGPQSPPQVLQEIREPEKETRPVAKPRTTDAPEAIEWEQKSYDAALQGDVDRTIHDATKAITLDPGRVNPYINRSWAYLEKGLPDRAVQDCRIALAIDPQNAYAYNNRGLARQRMAQSQSAREDYRKACDLGLDLGCQNLSALNNQSRIAELIDQSQAAFKAQNWDGVIRATTEVLNLDEGNAVAYTNRSAAYAQKSFLNKALKDSNEALRHNPNFALAYNNRGYVFELLGNNKKAAADYLKSCSLGLDLGCKNFERFNQ